MCQCRNSNLTFGQQVVMRIISGIIAAVISGIILAIIF